MFADDRDRYALRIDEVRVGDQIFTAAFRWETVTRIEPGERYSASTRVFTDRTGAEYAWRLANHHLVPALPVSLMRPVATPAMVHLETGSRTVIAFVGTHAEFFREPRVPVLAQAMFLGRGQGWEVMDLPNGLDPVRTVVASKTAALSLVKRAAKAHATALGLAVCAA